MKNRFFLFLFSVCLGFLSNPAFSKEKIFFEGDVSTAKVKAQTENKAILLDFTAKWCLPCRWMEKTVFQDQTVIDWADQNIIVVKIDVDDFDGINLKEYYKVNLLPTTILLDPKGKIISRKEESMSSDKFVSWITDQMSSNKIVPKKIDPKKETETSTATNKIEEQDVDDIEAVIKEAEKEESTQQQKDDEEIKISEISDKEIEDEIHAGEAEKMIVPMNYFIQTGLFKSFENAIKYAQQLDQKLNQNTSIISLDKENETVYQIALGAFETYEEASLFNDFLKTERIKGLVKKQN